MKRHLEAVEMLMRGIDLHDFEECVRRYSTAEIISQELSQILEADRDMRYQLQKLDLSMTLLREAIFGENEGCKSAQDRLDPARINLDKFKVGFYE